MQNVQDWPCLSLNTTEMAPNASYCKPQQLYNGTESLALSPSRSTHVLQEQTAPTLSPLQTSPSGRRVHFLRPYAVAGEESVETPGSTAFAEAATIAQPFPDAKYVLLAARAITAKRYYACLYESTG